MPEQRSVIVKPLPANNKSKGDRKDVNLRASFPNSPIHNGELTDEERKKAFQELVFVGIDLQPDAWLPKPKMRTIFNNH